MAEKKTKQKNKGKGEKTPPISAEAKALGDKIQAARKKKKLSQAQAGERLGITRQGFQHYERGNSLPTASDLPRFCELLGMDIREFGSAQDQVTAFPPTTDDALLLLYRLWPSFDVDDRKAVLDVAKGIEAVKRQRDLGDVSHDESVIGNENRKSSSRI